jgi:hypothetical protein
MGSFSKSTLNLVDIWGSQNLYDYVEKDRDVRDILRKNILTNGNLKEHRFIVGYKHLYV